MENTSLTEEKINKMPYPEFIRYVTYLSDPDENRGEKFIRGRQTNESLEEELLAIKEKQKRFKDKLKGKV